MTQDNKSYRQSMVWFTQDLRLEDNPVLDAAHQQSEAVLHCVFIGEILRPISMPGMTRPSAQRQHFVYQAIENLRTKLWQHGQQLLILEGRAEQHLSRLIDHYKLDAVFKSEQAGYNENETWKRLKSAFSQVHFIARSSSTLFTRQSLPFDALDCPGQFTPFRKKVEHAELMPRALLDIPVWTRALGVNNSDLNNLAGKPDDNRARSKEPSTPLQHLFEGGEEAAHVHLKRYFFARHASRYKETRNALMGFENSTKFSPWLALGSLSPVQIYRAVKTYEHEHGTNESTYWIIFELLWREFFYWRASIDGKSLFLKRGRKAQAPLNSFYPERFKAWCEGSTPEPLVNACMKELKQTGFMSNRGRQLVASYFVNDLQLDWRYGAAYFEQQLIDYDVASNWGNWQYLAGVGSDPRGLRRFDIAKQARQYDPNGHYVERWRGAESQNPVDHRDAADWPI